MKVTEQEKFAQKLVELKNIRPLILYLRPMPIRFLQHHA